VQKVKILPTPMDESMSSQRVTSRVRMSIGLAGAALAGVFVAGASTPDEATKTLRFTKRQLFVSPYESATTADLNRDGHVDIVSGAYWFAGPDFVPRGFRPNHASKDYLRANSDHVYDVDRDGWPDIIAGGWGPDGIFWYRNPGNSAAERGKPWEVNLPWEARLLSKTRGFMEMFALHDFNADGVPELYSACYRKKEPLEVWRFTTGADGAPALTPFVLGAEGGGHGFAFGDVNGDGREDVLTEIGWYERPAGDPFAQSWKLHAETALPHPSCPFVVKDLNGDGRLDIIFGRGHDVGLYWWEQQTPRADGTTVWKPHVIDESWSQAHVLALADLDGDGVEELVAGKCIWAHEGGDPGAADPPAVYYYRWNRSALRFTRHTIAAPGENIALGRQFAVTDLNGDGRLDVTAPSELGLWVFLNQGY
jgi:FG-GAP-like repeat